MWDSMMISSRPLMELFIRGGLVYAFVLFLVRISGKRQMGQLSAIEFVSILLVSNAVQNAMNAGDNSLIGGFVLASVIIGLSTFIAWLSFRSEKMRHLIEGVPVILIRHGQIIPKNLNRERINHGELMTMLRRQGVHQVSAVEIAILESDGGLSVTLHQST